MEKKFVGFFAVVLLLGLLAVPVLAATPEEIETSINSGLVWLDSQQIHDVNWDDGSWNGNPGITGIVLLKFEDRAKELGKDPLGVDYTYHATVQDGLDFLFSQMSVNGDKISIQGNNYFTSIALLALSASNNPGTVVAVPGSAVNGLTYSQVAQGLLNWVIAAQPASGCAEGGWGYMGADPTWADQSNAGYSVLSLTQAGATSPEGFGLTIPPATKTELQVFLGNVQVASGGSLYNPCWPEDSEWVNILKTGSLLQEHAFVGTPTTDPAVLDAIGYIEDNWNDAGPHPQYDETSLGWKDSYQAMFCMMKGLQSYDIQLLDTDADGNQDDDWFDEVSSQIVTHQNVDGSFQSINLGTGSIAEGDDNANLRAAWALLTLEKFVPPPPPSFAVEKDFRYTSVNFKPINCGTDTICGTPDDYQEPAVLGMTLPDADDDKKFEVKYVVDKKNKVTSTNPGQLYGVITITGAGVDTIVLNDVFGTQFDVNPAKLGGGVEVLKIDAAGLATVITNTPQVTDVIVNNVEGKVDLKIDLGTPLEANEKLMIYIKYQTTLKFAAPDTSDFLNTANVKVNDEDLDPAIATVEFI